MATLLKKYSVIPICAVIIFALSNFNAIAQVPRITSFTPTFGKSGDTIKIKGTGFLVGTIQVRFGGTLGSVLTGYSDTLMKVKVGVGSSGYVKVTKSTGSDSLAGFNYCGTVTVNSNAILKEPSTNTAAIINVGCGVTETYKIRKVLYATSYNWYMYRGINSKATIVHLNPLGENDTAVQVTFNTGYTQDSICVKGINACGTQSTTYGFVKPLGTLNPPTLQSITSSTNNLTPCIGDTVVYTVNANSIGTSYSPISKYSWTIPANTNITSSNSDSSRIYLKYNTGFTGGNISVLGQTCYGIKTALISLH